MSQQWSPENPGLGIGGLENWRRKGQFCALYDVDSDREFGHLTGTEIKIKPTLDVATNEKAALSDCLSKKYCSLLSRLRDVICTPQHKVTVWWRYLFSVFGA